MSNPNPETTLFQTERIEKHLFVLAAAVLLLSCLAGCASRYTIKAPEYARYNGEINQHKRLIRAQKSRIYQRSITRLLSGPEVSYEKWPGF